MKKELQELAEQIYGLSLEEQTQILSYLYKEYHIIFTLELDRFAIQRSE
jgi:hypothetical protein